MQNSAILLIEQIEVKVCKLQTEHLSLQEQFKETQNSIGRNLDDAALRMIEILDLINLTRKNMNLSDEALLIINKIEKRVSELLKRWQVHEIVFANKQIEPGKARVLETRQLADFQAGTILEICRIGYSRAGHVLRPADVITATGSITGT